MSNMKREVLRSGLCQNYMTSLIILLSIFLVLSAIVEADVIVQGTTIDVDSKLYVDSGTSNVGIGTVTPGYKLHVQDGDIFSSAYVRGGTGICISSDCKTSWPSSGSGLPSGTFGQTLRHDDTGWVSSSLLNNSGNDFIKIENSNEAHLALKNTEPDGREWALVSAGSLGGIGKGNFSIFDKTAGVSRLVIDSNGNIGIGTTNPQVKLDVIGMIRGTNGLTITAGAVTLPSGQIDNLEIANPSVTVTAGSGLSGGGIVSLGGSTSLSINANNANTWAAAQTFSASTNFPGSGIWNSGGSVGIGTIAPAQKLDVAGTVQMTGFKLTTAPTTGYVLTSDSSGVGSWQVASVGGGGSSGWTKSGTNVFVTNAVNDVVGIGTNSPQKKLHVLYNTAAGGAGATPGVVVENTGVQAEILLNPGATGNNWILSADDGTAGFRLIEETSPGTYTRQFQIMPASTAGKVNAFLPNLESTTSSTYPSLKFDTTNGKIHYTASSRRYKVNIKDMEEDFSKILQARPVVYNDAKTYAPGYGYIAEELDTIGLKNLVIYNKNYTPESVNYEMIGFYLVEVVKEQQKQIEEMNRTLQLQQKQIELLNDEIKN